MNQFNQSILEKGDALLYYGKALPPDPVTRADFVDWSIAVKTGYWLSHIEVYVGAGLSVASRNGIGVNRYPLRLEGLVCVRRPVGIADVDSATKWFINEASGQGYDFKGLLCFWMAVRQGSRKKQFCSEFALRWYRHAGIQPLNPKVDADRTAPCEFWKTGEFETIWQKIGFAP